MKACMIIPVSYVCQIDYERFSCVSINNEVSFLYLESLSLDLSGTSPYPSVCLALQITPIIIQVRNRPFENKSIDAIYRHFTKCILALTDEIMLYLFTNIISILLLESKLLSVYIGSIHNCI